MADIDAIRISELVEVNSADITESDELVLNDVNFFDDTDIVTKKVTIEKLVSHIETLELNFSNNVTFVNTIQAPPGQTLDGVFDKLTVRSRLKLNASADVKGLYFNRHLEDVEVLSPIQDGEILVWDLENLVWKNVEHDFIEEAPLDGGIYARQNGEWIDITDLLGGGGAIIIGALSITRGGIDLAVGVTDDFTVNIAGGPPEDAVYEWTCEPKDKCTVTDADKQTCNITFNEEGSFLIRVSVFSDTASNSPQQKTSGIFVGETARIIVEGTTSDVIEYISNEDLVPLEQDIAQTGGPLPGLQQPTATLSVDKTEIDAGQPIILTWSSTNGIYHTLTNVNNPGAVGNREIYPNEDTTYIYQVEGEAGTIPATATVSVKVNYVVIGPTYRINVDGGTGIYEGAHITDESSVPIIRDSPEYVATTNKIFDPTGFDSLNITFDRSKYQYVLTESQLRDDYAEACERWNKYLMISDENYTRMREKFPSFNGATPRSLDLRYGEAGAIAWVNSFVLLDNPVNGAWVPNSFGMMIDMYWYSTQCEQDYKGSYWLSNMSLREKMKSTLLHELGHVLGLTSSTDPYYNTYFNVKHTPGSSTGFLTTSSNVPKALSAYTPGDRIPLEPGAGTTASHYSGIARIDSSNGVEYPGLGNSSMAVYQTQERRIITDVEIGHCVDLGYLEINPGANEGPQTYNYNSTHPSGYATVEEELRAYNPNLPSYFTLCGFGTDLSDPIIL